MLKGSWPNLCNKFVYYHFPFMIQILIHHITHVSTLSISVAEFKLK